MERIQTEVEQALKIARKTRTSILFRKSSLESSLMRFYTVAQILGRKDDMAWAESELRGCFEELPKYRLKVRRTFLYEGRTLAKLFDDDVCFVRCRISVGVIERALDATPKARPKFVVSDRDIARMTDAQKKACRDTDSIRWQYTKRALVDVLSSTKLELIKRLNEIIGEITYGKIPSSVFKRFQDRVNTLLASSNPAAVSALNTAYENMGRSEDPERTAHVALSCRRLITAVADGLFPAQKQEYVAHDGEPHKVEQNNTINRLEAYVNSSGSANRKYLIKKLGLLRDMRSKMPQSINRGIHANISNADAEMLVIYSYLILGEILLCQDAVATKNFKPRSSKSAQNSPQQTDQIEFTEHEMLENTDEAKSDPGRV